MSEFIIQGDKALRGVVRLGGSKNAALPILAASLLTDENVILHNVPDISDVRAFLKILSELGAEFSFQDGTLKINTSGARNLQIDENLVKHMRASILLIGPLLARFGEVNLPFPGGCVLGKRSVHAHLHALSKMGAEVLQSDHSIHLKAQKLHSADIIMAEASVTATENAIMAAVLTKGQTTIRWAAMEPHVQDLCNFLAELGAEIHGIGTHTLTVLGGKALGGGEFSITPDYLEAGTMALAGIITSGDVILKNCPISQLDSFWQKLEEVGAVFEFTNTDSKGLADLHILPHKGLKAIEKLQTSVYPGFPTDLQAPFTVLLTQCEGRSKVHETLFEGRLNHLAQLEKMGARLELLNPHQAWIEGPCNLKGAEVISYDLRAGAAMVLAGLVAKGETIVHDINYIDRGYEAFEQKLKALGANIRRTKE